MKNILVIKSYRFALRVINLYKFLQLEKKEYVLSKQLLRSGTAIGALIKEAQHAQSKADFLNKMNISLKEANETEYWLSLLRDSCFLSEREFCSMNIDCQELLNLLVTTVKTTKRNLGRS